MCTVATRSRATLSASLTDRLTSWGRLRSVRQLAGWGATYTYPHPVKLHFTRSRTRRVYGTCSFGEIRLNLGPDSDNAEITETLLHEFVHVIEFERVARGITPDDHGPRFWAMFNLIADEIWPDKRDIFTDGDLTRWLRTK